MAPSARHRVCIPTTIRPIHEATRAEHNVPGATGRSSDSQARTDDGAPTNRRFPVPGCGASADDGVRSCIPLRDSPGFPPGSLSRRSCESLRRLMPTTLRMPPANQLRGLDYSTRTLWAQRSHLNHSGKPGGWATLLRIEIQM